jgi:hypothetical protein
MRTAEDQARNQAAKFHPQDPAEESSLPAIEVGGVVVFAYFDEGGRLRVSVDLDTADKAVVHGPDGHVHMEICVQGQPVYEAGDGGE